jgi:DNA polymerase III delta subunit
VILVTGPLDFFVEEAASRVAESLAAGGAERLRFDDDASPEAVSDALLNRSLFSPRRIVEVDVSRLLGTDAPAKLLEQALGAWDLGSPAGRREAFRKARALLSALDLPNEDPGETARKVASKTKQADAAPRLAELLQELPELKGPPDLFLPALRTLLERENDGVVALLTATAPPKGSELISEIAKRGLVLDLPVDEKKAESELARYARARADEREVKLEPRAIEKLYANTDGRAELFASELQKLLEWAGPEGTVGERDVAAQVEDDASEFLYALYDEIGRRDAGAALSRLQRIFSGRPVRMGRGMDEIDTAEYWPTRFFGFLTAELRRMLLLRSLLDDPGAGWQAGMSFNAFQARVLPRLLETRNRSGKPLLQGKPFAVYKLAERSARYRTDELARALARAADIDVQLKNSTPPLEALSGFVGRLIAAD